MRRRATAPPEHTSAIHPFAVLAEPALGSAVVALVASGEPIRPLRRQDGFFAIHYAADRVGYLPAAVCAPLAIGQPGSLAPLTIGQPIRMYRAPLPGAQFAVDPVAEQPEQPWLLRPGEELWLLGQDERFVLAQRADGSVGYIPAAVCGSNAAIRSSGLLDGVRLDWLGAGLGYGLLNWLALDRAVAVQVWADLLPRIYLGFGISLALALLLWLRGSPYQQARAFAVGIMIGYWLAHWFSSRPMIL